jgi:murein DD-endopeptidase MepM/ murein hydrolase activator NlpD
LPRTTRRSGHLGRLVLLLTSISFVFGLFAGRTTRDDVPVWIHAFLGPLARSAGEIISSPGLAVEPASGPEPVIRAATTVEVAPMRGTGRLKDAAGATDGMAPTPPQPLLLRLPKPDAAEPLPIQAAIGADLAAPTETVVVRRGDTLLNILARAGIRRSEAHEAINTLESIFDPRRLRPGQALELAFRSDVASGEVRLAALSLNVDLTSDLKLTRGSSGAFETETIEHELAREIVYVRADIDDTLYDTAAREGLPVSSLAEFVKIFSWDVDFQRDLHPGNAFEAVVEQAKTRDGTAVVETRLLFAALNLKGRRIEAYRFEREDGSADFFDAAGRPLRKWLLRTPVDGARLSSKFGPRRHPILGYTRMHKGIDFAAPTGTPVFAAGDGSIEFVGVNKGYGKYIRLRHNGEYATAYAHLSRYAPGLKPGARVKQGQVIGYVGTTGMSTGPHLHYEILKSGQQINPLSVETLDAVRLAGAELRRFARTVEEVAQLRTPPKTAENYAQRTNR